MKNILASSILTILLCGTCFAQSKDKLDKPSKEDTTSKVIAEGVGTTADEALKDAFRNAVRQVVGVLIDADTLVKNDETISEKLLAFSAIYIAKYDEIAMKQDKGLFRVKISAVVKRGGILDKLKETRVAFDKIDGADIATGAITKKEARENATALLRKAFADLPKVLVGEVKKPTLADYDEDTSMLTLYVTVKVDESKYKSFTQNLTQTAEKVCLHKSSQMLTAVKNSDSMYDINLPDFNFEKLRCQFAKGWMLALLTDGKGDRSRWNFYVLDSDPRASLSSLMGKISVVVKLNDKTGSKVSEDEFDPLHDDFGSVTYHKFWLGHSRSKVRVTSNS